MSRICVSLFVIVSTLSQTAADEVDDSTSWRSAAGLAIEELGVSFGSDELREPLAIAVDQRHYVYVADAMAGKVFRFAENGESIEFEAPPSDSDIYPIDLAVEGAIVYVLDYTRNSVLRYDYRGAFLDVYLSFDEFESMRPISFTASEGGRFITTDIKTHSVTIWTPLLQLEQQLGEFGWAEGAFDGPRKVASLPDGGIGIVESGNRRIQILSASGRFERVIEPLEDSSLRAPRWIAADGRGNLFVTDPDAGSIFVFSSEGALLLEIDSYGGEEISPAAVAIGWDDHLYVTDLRSKSVLVFALHYE
jgi:tripartite motif-containing protein 2/3/tripartite motif-containing protein 71